VTRVRALYSFCRLSREEGFLSPHSLKCSNDLLQRVNEDYYESNHPRARHRENETQEKRGKENERKRSQTRRRTEREKRASDVDALLLFKPLLQYAIESVQKCAFSRDVVRGVRDDERRRAVRESVVRENDDDDV